ncbi:MAG: zinc-ribbon domain-containing protein, partial [Planctomycetota bacterium]
MYCPKCGAENPEGAELCVSCSWVLSGMPSVGVNVEAKT